MSGCETNTNRPAIIIPDTGVKYTGPSIESLGICQGDYLDEIEAIVLQKLVDYSTSVGISIEDLDFEQCPFLEEFTQCCIQDNSLKGIVEGILSTFCNVGSQLSSLNTSVATLVGQTNTILPGCLTVANTKIDTVLNKLISEYCQLVVNLQAVFGSDLSTPVINNIIITQIEDSVIDTVFNNIQGCSPRDVVKTGTGRNTTITLRGANPIGAFVFGDWPISHFNSDGTGKAEYGLCGYAICNGGPFASDLRGFTLSMATNIPGPGGLNPRVDPTINLDADFATNIGDVKGLNKVKLTGAECALAPHTHIINDLGHTHPVGPTRVVFYDDNNAGNSSYPLANDSTYHLGSTNSFNTQAAFSNLTIRPNDAIPATSTHENRQPTVYVNCIQRIS